MQRYGYKEPVTDEQLINMIDQLEELNDCREITKLLVP